MPLKPNEVRMAETDAEPTVHHGNTTLSTDAYHLVAPDFVTEEAVRFDFDQDPPCHVTEVEV